MMEKYQFRVGNIYQPTDGSNEAFKSATIEDLSAWHNGAIYGKPVLLTERWLQDFGLHQSRFDIYSYKLRDTPADLPQNINFHVSGIMWKPIIDTIAFDSLIEIQIAPDIMFVHQFQNLIYALSGIDPVYNGLPLNIPR